MTSTIIQVAIAAAQATALLMSVAFITYVIVLIRPFMRDRPRRAGDAQSLAWHFFVPALNEERVIGQTIDHLRATFPDMTSGSSTTLARTAPRPSPGWAPADPWCIWCAALPEARTGKGDALNAGYQALSDWLPARTDRSRTIIGVVDADGRLASNCLDVCAGTELVRRPGVGSVQVHGADAEPADRYPLPTAAGSRTCSGTCWSGSRTWSSGCRSPRSRSPGRFTRRSASAATASSPGCPRWTSWPTTKGGRGEARCSTTTSSACTCCSPGTGTRTPRTPTWTRRRCLTSGDWSGSGPGGVRAPCSAAATCASCGRHSTSRRSAALEATYYLIQPWLQLVGTFVYPVPPSCSGQLRWRARRR